MLEAMMMSVEMPRVRLRVLGRAEASDHDIHLKYHDLNHSFSTP